MFCKKNAMRRLVKIINMRIVRLFKYKNSIHWKKPAFNEDSRLDSLNDFIMIDLLNIEIVYEFLINVPDNFSSNGIMQRELAELCGKAKETIEHYFIPVGSNYGLIQKIK